jgi:hypothetical protein
MPRVGGGYHDKENERRGFCGRECCDLFCSAGGIHFTIFGEPHEEKYDHKRVYYRLAVA